MFELLLPDCRKITVKLSYKAKSRISIHILSCNEVRLSVPPHVMHDKAWGFLLEKQDWIAANLPSTSSASIKKKIPNKVFVLGEEIPLIYCASTENCRAVFDGKHMQILGKKDDKSVISAIQNCLINQAQIFLAKRLYQKAKQFQITFSDFALSNAKRSWGCCTSRRKILLNWRLIQMPEKIIDYVIAHELAHLQYMNHSKQFWELLDIWHSTWNDDRSWLRKNNFQLLDF